MSRTSLVATSFGTIVDVNDLRSVSLRGVSLRSVCSRLDRFVLSLRSALSLMPNLPPRQHGCHATFCGAAGWAASALAAACGRVAGAWAADWEARGSSLRLAGWLARGAHLFTALQVHITCALRNSFCTGSERNALL